MGETAASFTRYLDDGLLPFRQVERRVNPQSNVALILASHAPSPGIHYEPVDELVVSLVLQSSRASVVRDVGFGPQSFREKTGSILITPPRTESYWYFESSPQVLHMGFPHPLLDDFSPEHVASLGRLAAEPLHDPLLAALATRLWDEAADQSMASSMFCEHALTTILAALFTKVDGAELDGGTQAARRAAPALPAWRVRKAKDIMLAHLGQGIPTVEIARHVGLSTHHFLRAFAAATGQTPHQWMVTQRIDRAMNLLRKGERSITEIALELGFSSSSHFSASFRKVTGVTPRQWRDHLS